ncbi:hopanoid-associated sugar epimerase [Jiella sp. M17.18]|uniref:hopanoid-associated sugar epimerase n=1 Tax=Jiella sp. M17.18 TaxID=3234247 RepID=UPI0034DF9587
MLISGASGFLGSALVRSFTGAGFAVRALVRRESPRQNLSGTGAEVVEGDLNDAASLRAAVSGMRYLVHAAADYRLWTREPAALLRTNVEGTRAIMRAAAEGGVERIVYTSSVAVLKPSQAEPSDETATVEAHAAVGIYKRSKVLAEEAVRALADDGLPVVIANPSTPIGPRDIRPTPTGRIIVEAAAGRMPAYVDTGLNLVHVDDVAEGHLLALRHGRIGERYILGGENVALSDMLAEIARQLGRRPPRVKLPVGAVMPLAAAAEAMSRFTGKEPFVSFDALRMARQRMFFDDTKARRDLGYRSRPWQEAVGDALAWFRAAGMIA